MLIKFSCVLAFVLLFFLDISNLYIAPNTAYAQTGSCPVSMPEIKSAIVFQSVEAPQIEPMNRQEYQHDPDNPSFKSYDLVMRKPAGVLVELAGANMDRNKEFALDMFITGDNKYRNQCFHEALKGEMIKGEEDYCFFTKDNLKAEGYHKLFPLPMKEDILNREVKDISIQMSLYPRGYSNNKSCLKRTFFNLSVIKTPALKLGFSGINAGANCKAYKPVSPSRLEEFVKSNEVVSYIPSSFPIPWSKAETAGYIKGVCNNNPDIERYDETTGILRDIDSLEWKRQNGGYSKLVAVVPIDYFNFHNILDNEGDPAAGVMIGPKWKGWKWFAWWKWLNGFLGGSWNVAFVADDQVNEGTVAHELAHTLGQGRELYDKNELCQQFRGSPFFTCPKYLIPRALDIFWRDGKQIWNIAKNKFSIGNNEGTSKTQWVDRDTFQKMFLVLSKVGAIAPHDVDIFLEAARPNQAIQKPAYSLIFSSFYNSKEKSFTASKQRIQKEVKIPFVLPKIKDETVPLISVQLREGENLIQEIQHPVLEMEKKVFYRDGSVKSFPFPFSPIMTGFKLSQDYKGRDLRIVILGPKGKRIESYSIFKKDEKNRNSQEVVFVDREY